MSNSIFQPLKSPGEYDVFPVLIQNGLEILLSILIKLNRANLSRNYIPLSWSAARVVYIPEVSCKDPPAQIGTTNWPNIFPNKGTGKRTRRTHQAGCSMLISTEKPNSTLINLANRQT